MLDRLTNAFFAPSLHWVARRLQRAHVRANHVTLAGFVVGIAALPALVMGHTLLALALILLNRLADGVDGALARLTMPTERGAFLDICLDFIFYASVPLGFALADPARNALPAAVLLFGFMGTAASFLAYAAIAAKRGAINPMYSSKSIYYLGGLTESTETVAFFAACCLWPAWFALLAYVFAALCGLTTVVRLYAGWTAFKQPNQ
jgi:phosphatidylglycerophosphate synthase